MFDPQIPNNDLPLLPPSFNFNDVDLLKLVNIANKWLIKFDNWVERLPNPNVLVNIFAIREWVASSSIEQIHTTVEKVLVAQQMDIIQRHKNDQKVIDYISALQYWAHSVKENDAILLPTLQKINSILIWSDQWIISKPDKTIDKKDKYWNITTIYTPPQWIDLIMSMVSNLIEYINTDHEDIDPLLKLWFIKYQLAAIHPFGDWNWREWRILIILYLILVWTIKRPTLFISEYIEQNKEIYYQFLNNIDRRVEWAMKEFITYLLEWIIHQSKNTLKKVEDIDAIIKKYKKILKEWSTSKIYSIELTDYLFTYPISTIGWYAKNLQVTNKTAGVHLKKIVNKWLLSVHTIWNNKLFINQDYLDIILDK